MSPSLPPSPKSRSSAPPPRNSSSSSSSPIEEEREGAASDAEGKKATKQSLSSLSLSLPLSLPPLSSKLGSVEEEKTATKQQLQQNPTSARAFLPSMPLPSGRAGRGWAGESSTEAAATHYFLPLVPRADAHSRPIRRSTGHEPPRGPPGSFRQAPVELHGACCCCPSFATCQPVLRR